MREYGPKIPAEKLLVFADTCGCLIQGWGYWAAEGDRFFEEERGNAGRGTIPETHSEKFPTRKDQKGLTGRRGFFAYVKNLYEGTDQNGCIQELLDEEANKLIRGNITDIEKKLSGLQQP